MGLESWLSWQPVNHELTSHQGQALVGHPWRQKAQFSGLQGVVLGAGPSLPEDQHTRPPSADRGGFVTLSGTEAPSSLLRDEATQSP